MQKILTISKDNAAWPMERKLFAAARARCAQAVLLDSNLSGAEKRVIGICLYRHMNPGEQWSCFASMATLAKEGGVCERVCWNAIQKAATAGHILRRLARRDRGGKIQGDPPRNPSKLPARSCREFRKLSARFFQNSLQDLAE
jgi:hypothetical protein